MYSLVEVKLDVSVELETALTQHDAYKAMNLFIDYHQLELNQHDKFDISLHENALKYPHLLDFNLPALRNIIPRIINKPISNTLILKFLEFYKKKFVEVGIIFYSRLYCKKNLIDGWDEVSKICKDYFNINLDVNTQELEGAFQDALDEKNYTKALALFKKMHFLDLSDISFSGLSQILSAINNQIVWDKKISNSYLKMICSHIKKRSEVREWGNELKDEFYFCILKQRQNIENWEEIEFFYNSIFTTDYYHVFYLAACDFSLSSMRYLLENECIKPQTMNKFWYSTCYDTYKERQFDGYCGTRYGEDSSRFKEYVTLPALFLVIAILTRPDKKYSAGALFNVIQLLVCHDANCTSYIDGVNRGINIYLSRYKEVKTRFLKQDERIQFDFEWDRIQTIIAKVKDKTGAFPTYKLFNHDDYESGNECYRGTSSLCKK